MPAMIYIRPASTSAFAGNIVIQNSQFISNKNTHFIEVKSPAEIVPWQLSTYINLNNTNVSLNEHHNGSSLISITNGLLYLYENSTFMNNSYYKNIIMLHLSTIIYSGYSVIAYNSVRFIMETTYGSYFIMNVSSILNIYNNTVYNIAKQMYKYRHTTQPVCLIQFYSPYNLYDHHPDEINV